MGCAGSALGGRFAAGPRPETSDTAHDLPPPSPAALAQSAVLLCGAAHAAVIGTNTPAEAISAARIDATLPAKDREAWKAYPGAFQKSRTLADRAALAAELEPGQPARPSPRKAPAAPRPCRWTATRPGTRRPRPASVADVIVSFQTPAGGWSKNRAAHRALRQPGQPYAADNVSKHLSENDFDAPRDPRWNLCRHPGQQRHHHRAALPGAGGRPSVGTPRSQAWRASFLRGARHLLARPVPERRLAPGLAAGGRLSRRHHL